MQRLATWSKLRFGVEAMKATALVAALIATAVATSIDEGRFEAITSPAGGLGG